jgi:hypothetical protein
MVTQSTVLGPLPREVRMLESGNKPSDGAVIGGHGETSHDRLPPRRPPMPACLPPAKSAIPESIWPEWSILEEGCGACTSPLQERVNDSQVAI